MAKPIPLELPVMTTFLLIQIYLHTLIYAVDSFTYCLYFYIIAICLRNHYLNIFYFKYFHYKHFHYKHFHYKHSTIAFLTLEGQTAFYKELNLPEMITQIKKLTNNKNGKNIEPIFI